MLKKTSAASAHALKLWPFWVLVCAFFLEFFLSIWVVSMTRLSAGSLSPTLILLTIFLLWFWSNATLGLFGSALLGALFLNAVVDASFAWTLLVGAMPGVSAFSVLVPTAHFLIAIALLIWASKARALQMRWLFSGFLSFFVLRALLLIPVAGMWSGEIAGMTQKVSKWTGLEVRGENTPLEHSEADNELEKIINDELARSEDSGKNAISSEKKIICERPNGERYSSLSAMPLTSSPIVWTECGFDKTIFIVDGEDELNLKNMTHSPVQLKFSSYDVDHAGFGDSWDFVLLPNSTQTISQFKTPERGAIFIYSPDHPELGIGAVFSKNSRDTFWVEHSPFKVSVEHRE